MPITPIVQTTVVWPADLTNPTDPAQLHQMKCSDDVNGTVVPNPGLLPDAIGGVVWKTWTHGDVRFEGARMILRPPPRQGASGAEQRELTWERIATV